MSSEVNRGKEHEVEAPDESKGTALRKRRDHARQARSDAISVFHLIKPGLAAKQSAAKTCTARNIAGVNMKTALAPLDAANNTLKAIEQEIIDFEKGGGTMDDGKRGEQVRESDAAIAFEDGRLAAAEEELRVGKARCAAAEELKDDEMKKRVVLVSARLEAAEASERQKGASDGDGIGEVTEQAAAVVAQNELEPVETKRLEYSDLDKEMIDLQNAQAVATIALHESVEAYPDPTAGMIDLQNALAAETEKRLDTTTGKRHSLESTLDDGAHKTAESVKPPKKRKVALGDEDDDDDEGKTKKLADMSPEEQATLRKQGESAITTFLKTGKTISFRIRRYIRESQEFLPQAATTSRELAMHIFGTNRGSTICIYHQRHRSFNQHDGYDGKYVMKGITYPKTLNTASARHTPQPGHLHCGCNIDIALMGFFFWKTWILTSSHPKLNRLTESMKDEDLQPRARAFVVEAYGKASYLTLDDIYSADWGSPEYEQQIRLCQINNILEQMNAQNKLQGQPEKMLTDVTPVA